MFPHAEAERMRGPRRALAELQPEVVEDLPFHEVSVGLEVWPPPEEPQIELHPGPKIRHAELDGAAAESVRHRFLPWRSSSNGPEMRRISLTCQAPRLIVTTKRSPAMPARRVSGVTGAK